MVKFESSLVLEIPFYDLDPMNVVWHGNYVKYLEAARCEMFRQLRYTYEDMKNDGVAYPVAKMDLKFIKSCRFGQKIIVTTLLEEIEPCIIIKYIITDASTGEKLLKARSIQICIDAHSGESIHSAPVRLKEIFEECKI